MIWLCRLRKKQMTEDRATLLHSVASGFFLPMNQHHSHAFAGVQQDDAAAFKGPPYLIARRFIHLKSAAGFEALQSGQ